MSAVQFRCHFWPFNFTYGCIVCLAGPWIREPFLESCWDKNLGTATPHSGSDRRWQTKGHRDENRLHCAFKAWVAESDCSGGSGFVVFQRETSVFWKLCRGLGAEASTPPKMACDFWKIWATPGVMRCPSPEAAEVQQLQLRCFSKSVLLHYLNLEKHENINMLSHLSFPFFSSFLPQTHHTDAFSKAPAIFIACLAAWIISH